VIPAAIAADRRTVQQTVQRFVVYTLLFVLVLIAASGASGLLARLLGSGSELASGDAAGLAQPLAFFLVGGPLAAVLWWAVWRRLREPDERSSLAWGLYLAAMYVVAMVVSTSSFLAMLSELVAGRTAAWWSGAGTAAVWGAVWFWHWWIRRRSGQRALRLSDVPTAAGVLYGLVVGTGGAVTALASLFGAAVDAMTSTTAVGKPWWVFALQALAWAAGGSVLWWWHWSREGGARLRSRLADVVLVVAGILGAGMLGVTGATMLLFVLLRLGFDRSEPVPDLLEPLGSAAAAALVGAVVWLYHHSVSQGRSEATQQAARLVASGVSLAAAAAGIGVIVNSVLALAGSTLAGAAPRTLLLGGISALVVGAPLWWRTWHPLRTGRREPPADQGEPAGRRVYLIAVFGVSAAVALVTMLVIGYRAFEVLLDGTTAGSLVDRVRAPLGLLAATGLVAGYHYSVWRHERPALAAAAASFRGIRHVVLVAGPDPDPWRLALEGLTGARVTVWKRADGQAVAAMDHAGAAGDEGPVPDRLAGALEGIAAERVLVIVGPGRLEVIALES